MLWIIMVLCVIASAFTESWAYLYPQSFLEYFTQQQLIIISVVCNISVLILFIIIGIKTGCNTHSLWLAIPIFSTGVFLFGYGFLKLGKDRTFFGTELGTVEPEIYDEFPFSLGHTQYKGMLLAVFGMWLLFHPSHQLTAITGFWIITLCVQMYIESSPSLTGPVVRQ